MSGVCPGRRQLAYLRSDVHSPFNLRVDRIVSCFPEFYEAFVIQPGDGMFVPPEARVFIWYAKRKERRAAAERVRVIRQKKKERKEMA